MNLNPFIDLIIVVLKLYTWVLVAWIIVSWLLHFNIINRYSNFVAKLSQVLYQLTQPVLRPIQRVLPNFGGIDISPIIVFLIIRFIINVLYTYFYAYS